MRYRNVSGHPEDLEDGRVVGAGEFIELSDEDLKSEHNKEKIDRLQLIEAPKAKPKEPTAPDQPEEQRSRAKKTKSGGSA